MSEDFRSFFAHYADRYMASDADAVVDLCDAPFTGVRGGRAIHLADRAAAVEHFADLKAAYRSAGAAAADIVEIDVLAQGRQCGARDCPLERSLGDGRSHSGLSHLVSARRPGAVAHRVVRQPRHGSDRVKWALTSVNRHRRHRLRSASARGQWLSTRTAPARRRSTRDSTRQSSLPHWIRCGSYCS